MNLFYHKEPHRLNAVYGWRALLCNLGFHVYRQQACWAEGTDWWQHECKYCGHTEDFEIKGGKEMGEEIFPERHLKSRHGSSDYS